MASWNMTKVARGFLELLAGRNMGRTPQTVNDELVPTLDCREFMASSQLFGTGGGVTTGALANLTDGLGLTATLGLKAVGAELIIGAAAATNVSLSVGVTGVGGGSEYIPLAFGYFNNLAAGQIVNVGCVVPNWVLPPGATIFARAYGAAAGADHSLDVNALIENYVSQF